MQFGVSIARQPEDPLNITHNLRTAIVDAEGKLVKIYTGNEWTPDQLLEDLKALAASR
jgi:cytochrome oxidase Cu insertion factor (SCO1/SenC/PrrC family)